MTDFIIVAIIVVLIVIGIGSGRKHFKGEGGCCGGGSGEPMKKQNKKLDNVIAQKVVVIEGMTCDHCKNWVEKSINSIDGAAAKVNLKKKEAVVFMEKEISDEIIREAVQNAGYTVIDIK